MLLAFFLVTFFIFLILFSIWSTSGYANKLLKIVFLLMTFWSSFILFSLLPTVVLPNGMRLM